MTIDHFNYNTKCRANSASKKMEKGEEKEDLRTVECLRGRLLAERQVSRSVKDETDLITRKMEELEKHLKEEIRLREKAEKRLKFLMKKLEFIKESQSFEGSEQLSSSEVSCLSSVSKEEEKETYENGLVEEEKADQTAENVASMEEEEDEEEESNSKLKDVSSGEESVAASTSSHEAESQASNDFS